MVFILCCYCISFLALFCTCTPLSSVDHVSTSRRNVHRRMDLDRRSSNPPQGRMRYSGVTGFSPSAYRSMADSAQSSSPFRGKSSSHIGNSPRNFSLPLYGDKFSRPGPDDWTNSSSLPFRNNSARLGGNTSANSSHPSLRNKSSRLSKIPSSAVNQAQSVPPGVCPLPGVNISAAPGAVNSALKQKSLKSTNEKSNSSSSQLAPLHTNPESSSLPPILPQLNMSSVKFHSRRKAISGDESSDQRTGAPNLNPEGWTAEDVARWPGTDTVPVPPPGHNIYWSKAWIRGKAAWNALPYAHASLQDNDFVNLNRWDTQCNGGYFAPVDLCGNDGLLIKVDEVDGNSIHFELCSTTYINWNYYCSARYPKVVAYKNSLSTLASSIINWHLGTDDHPNEVETWADTIIQQWREQSANYSPYWPSYLLQYITFANLEEGEIIHVVEDMVAKDPTLAERDTYNGNTRMATYSPDDEDDNFFALLGTSQGLGAVELLYNYPYMFSTPMGDGSREVKSIKNVRFSGNIPESKETWQHYGPDRTHLFYHMTFTTEQLRPADSDDEGSSSSHAGASGSEGAGGSSHH